MHAPHSLSLIGDTNHKCDLVNLNNMYFSYLQRGFGTNQKFTFTERFTSQFHDYFHLGLAFVGEDCTEPAESGCDRLTNGCFNS